MISGHYVKRQAKLRRTISEYDIEQTVADDGCTIHDSGSSQDQDERQSIKDEDASPCARAICPACYATDK